MLDALRNILNKLALTTTEDDSSPDVVAMIKECGGVDAITNLLDEEEVREVAKDIIDSYYTDLSFGVADEENESDNS